MSEIATVIGDNKVFGYELRKKGSIPLERFHKALVPWFSKYKYLFNEKGITHKDTVDPIEQYIVWIATRNIDSYFRFHINVNIVSLRQKQGRGEIVIQFRGYLEKDYRNSFEKLGNFGKTLRRIFERYVIKEKAEAMEDKVRAETNEFIQETKRVLNFLVR